jgi:hypothetical protein
MTMDDSTENLLIEDSQPVDTQDTLNTLTEENTWLAEQLKKVSTLLRPKKDPIPDSSDSELSRIETMERALEELMKKELQEKEKQYYDRVQNNIHTTVEKLMPTAIDNDLHFTVLNQCIQEEIGANPRQYYPPHIVQQITERAIKKAKQILGSNPSEGSKKAIFSESANNWVQPNTHQAPKNILSMINAHINNKNRYE